jgi:hypothetical protein
MVEGSLDEWLNDKQRFEPRQARVLPEESARPS